VQVLAEGSARPAPREESGLPSGTVLLTAEVSAPVVNAYARFGFPLPQVISVGENGMAARQAVAPTLAI